jgi:hypothetical protein
MVETAKIDRRLQKPDLLEAEKEALWGHRRALFAREVDTAELDACLRTIDRRAGYRSR